eukprot:TRINITY_DN18754_c0_g1_i3.p1 TRINITY_DN18754_c0_g1~~TRINITY_DN18754_c0_g1_i3.p1  ORF type:complete len:319 (+),score=51.32 TRINITY_DN18754_c0_g1_i3:97-1053(+)
MSEIKDMDMTPSKVQELLESQLRSIERQKKLDPKFEEEVERKKKQDLKEIKSIVKNDKSSNEEKLADVKKKALKLVEEVVELRLECAREVTICEGVKVHRDKLLKENQKSEALCEKLQQLCRELQRQNSSIIEKTETSCQQEAALRDKLKEDFQSKLDAISEKVTQQGQEKEQLITQNKELQQKLDGILKGYSETESQVQKFCEARDAERELAKLQLEQQSQLVLSKDEELLQYQIKYEAAKKLCDANTKELEEYRSQYENIQNVVNDAKMMVSEAAKEKEKTAKMYQELAKERNECVSSMKDMQQALTKNSFIYNDV